MSAPITMEWQIAAGVRVRFSARPPDAVLALLRVNGFRWCRPSGEWTRRRVVGTADLLGRIDRMLNPDRPDGACWKCGAPGRFRNRGAATPVFCDDCDSLDVESRNLTGRGIR